ncbi:enoyl-CoA hydratase/isomerase family protein [Minwuia thermotolerans]|uniref:enoyl-CoA hydratase/isomerase family protein n=1 Tax=Minwuia thermotolerans TaxID=2056226 RepID=UPI0013DDF9F0|nr:enoyl-CoA hydratase-related protein [Minwuia thermotolerans]
MTNYPDFEFIRLARVGTRAWLTFNRPEARNALTHRMMEEIGEALAAVRADAEARVLILRGAGGSFSAGGDLNAMQEMPPAPAPGEADPLFQPYRFFGDVLRDLDRMPIPVVAVVEGGAAGGGFGMTCCADVAIIRADAKFALPEPKVGFIPSQILPFIARRIGAGQLRRIAVLGQRIGGEEAFRLGVGHYLARTETETEEILAAVLDEVDRNDPAAVAAVKEIVLMTEEAALDETLDKAAQHLIRLLRRPEAPAGMRAFLNKQPPPWLARAREMNGAGRKQPHPVQSRASPDGSDN